MTPPDRCAHGIDGGQGLNVRPLDQSKIGIQPNGLLKHVLEKTNMCFFRINKLNINLLNLIQPIAKLKTNKETNKA